MAEGVRTAKSAHDLAAREGVPMPIVNEVYSVLYENKSPKAAVYDLMVREAHRGGAVARIEVYLRARV